MKKAASHALFIILVQIIQIIKSLFLAPLVLFYTFFAVIILIAIKDIFFGGDLGPLFDNINHMHSWGDFTISTSAFIKIFFSLTTFIYILTVIMSYILKVRVIISFETKLKLILLINLILVVFFMVIIVPTTPISENVHEFSKQIMIVFLVCIFGIPLAFLVIILDTFKAIIETLEEFLLEKSYPIIKNIKKEPKKKKKKS